MIAKLAIRRQNWCDLILIQIQDLHCKYFLDCVESKHLTTKIDPLSTVLRTVEQKVFNYRNEYTVLIDSTIDT